MEARSRKRLIAAGKVVVSLLLLYFIFTRIPFQEALAEIRRALSPGLIAALALFVLSKIIAAFRLNLYFHQIDIPLATAENFKLYLLGMFYNLFLPGGIGGDAYKGYVLKRSFQVKTKRVIAALLLDRISGMVVLTVLAMVLTLVLPVLNTGSHKAVLIAILFLGLGIYYAVSSKYFNYLHRVFWKSLLYSAGVQLAQLFAVWFILMSFGINMDEISYLLVFLVSSIVAVIPVTIGGIGSRELVFYYGAKWMDLQQDVAVSVSIIFFAITALVSLMGVYYHFRKPVLK